MGPRRKARRNHDFGSGAEDRSGDPRRGGDRPPIDFSIGISNVDDQASNPVVEILTIGAYWGPEQITSTRSRKMNKESSALELMSFLSNCYNTHDSRPGRITFPYSQLSIDRLLTPEDG